MFSETSNSTLALAGSASVLFLTACYYCPAKLLRWIERKRYQYEVTFSLYMMTPTEKFIFNSILFLFLSMVTIAASLYLPEHISFITRRAFYYVAGDADHSSGSAKISQTLLQNSAAAFTGTVAGGVKEAAETVKEVVSAAGAGASSVAAVVPAL